MMYSKNKKGFSLAELLISLLIISIVLAAAIPTITKRNAAGGEKIWHWTQTNNGVYTAVGSNQSAIVGADQLPFDANASDANYGYLKKFFQDTDVFSSDAAHWSEFAKHFNTSGDKLFLLKKTPDGEDVSGNKQALSNFTNSHISFYTINANDPTAATTKDIHYAGRLAADKHNLALGIASLQSFNTTLPEVADSGFNTALGHHSLTYNRSGLYNSAVGEKTLTRNRIGNHNTALGYSAMMLLDSEGTETDNTLMTGNTALGSLALSYNKKGQNNTSVGFLSLLGGTEGSYNTAIGNAACSNIKGDYNICLGSAAGSRKVEDDVNYSLNIGVSRDADDPNLNGSATNPKLNLHNIKYDTPLITGNLQAYSYKGLTYDKTLQVNAKEFSVNTFDGNNPAFKVTTITGNAAADEYKGYNIDDGEAPIPSRGIIDFDLLNEGDASLRMTFGGTLLDSSNSEAQIYAYNKYKFTSADSAQSEQAYRDIRINDMFKMDFTGGDSSNARRVDLSTQGQSHTPDGILTLNNLVAVNGNHGFGIINSNNGIAQNGVNYGLYVFNSDANYGNVSSVQFNDLNVKGNGSLVTNVGDISLYATNDNIYLGAKKDVQIASTDGEIIAYSDIVVSKGAGLNVKITNEEITIGGDLNVGQKIRDIDAKLQTLQAYHSDARLKNISGDSTAGLKEINALEVKNYTYKNDKEKTPHVGVIAQQLQKIFPNSVTKDEDGYLRIRTEEIFFAMVNSIKELFVKVQDLTAKVTGLDKRITELEEQNKLLKQQNEAFEKRLAKLEKQAAK